MHDDPQLNGTPVAGAEASIERHRALGVELLAVVERLAAAMEELQRLEREHTLRRSALRNLYASATTAADRIDRRLAIVRDLAAAATRAQTRLAESTDHRVARARSVNQRIADELERLERARVAARHTVAELALGVTEHERAGRALFDLRTDLAGLRPDAERGLALLSESARALEVVRT